MLVPLFVSSPDRLNWNPLMEPAIYKKYNTPGRKGLVNQKALCVNASCTFRWISEAD
jgi:hypothetical protein